MSDANDVQNSQTLPRWSASSKARRSPREFIAHAGKSPGAGKRMLIHVREGKTGPREVMLNPRVFEALRAYHRAEGVGPGDLLQVVRARVLAHLVRRGILEPGSDLTVLDDGFCRPSPPWHYWPPPRARHDAAWAVHCPIKHFVRWPAIHIATSSGTPSPHHQNPPADQGRRLATRQSPSQPGFRVLHPA